MKKNNKWITIKSNNYPKDGEEVEIKDDVGKIRRAMYCGSIPDSFGGGGAGWMIENDIDLGIIIKWRNL